MEARRSLRLELMDEFPLQPVLDRLVQGHYDPDATDAICMLWVGLWLGRQLADRQAHHPDPLRLIGSPVTRSSGPDVPDATEWLL